MNVVVEPLSHSSALGQDPHGPIPFLAAKNLPGKQLTDFSRARFKCSERGGKPLTFSKQGCFVHAFTLSRSSASQRAYAGR